MFVVLFSREMSFTALRKLGISVISHFTALPLDKYNQSRPCCENGVIPHGLFEAGVADCSRIAKNVH